MLLWSNPAPWSAGRRRGRVMRPLTILTVAAIVALAGPALPAVAAPTDPVVEVDKDDLIVEEISFRRGDATVRGTVVAPPGRAHPGLVMVHGSGHHTRAHYRQIAEAFARRGVATLVYDKRTAGYSRFQRNYSVLADDALAAVEALRAHDSVDPDNVGVWGISEGGWVAPLAASRSSKVAFLVTVAANGGPPARSTAWADDVHLRDAGVSGSLLHTVQTLTRLAVDAGIFAEARHDPVPVLERVTQPVLALWGEMDKLTPPAESLRTLQRVLAASGNDHVTLRTFPDAGHSLYRNSDGYSRSDQLAPGYPDLVTSWVNAVAAGHPPASSASPAPPQDRPTPPLPPLAWYESPWVLLNAIALSLVAFASYPLTAVVRWLSGHRGVPPARRPARLLAAAGALTVLGFVGYLMAVRSAGVEGAGLVFGRPVPWLVLQLLALVVVALTATTAARWWRSQTRVTRGGQARLGLLLTGGVVFVPWALYWGLLVP